MQVAIGRGPRPRAAGQKPWNPLAARLVVIPKPPQAAEASRKKALRASQRGGHKAEAISVMAADYLFLITTLESDHYPPDVLHTLYKRRWQIELAFKRLKSLIHIDRLPTKDPRLAKAWLHAHLIIAILTDTITPQLRDSPPCAGQT